MTSTRSFVSLTLLGTAVSVAAALGVRAAHRRQLAWGATAGEAVLSLPGDALISLPDLVATRAIDVDAPPSAVWPWLAQIGQGRGGFYSYDALENLVGLNIHSAKQVVPAWQDIKVGDEVNLAATAALRVAMVIPDEALVLHGAGPLDPDDAAQDAPFDFSWAFVVQPRADGSRLLVRERYTYLTGWARYLVVPVSWVSWFMTQRMLRGIRDRANTQRPARR